MIFYSSRNLFKILFALYYLLQLLKEMKLLVSLFIQIRSKQFDFYRTLSRYLQLYVLFTLDCSDFVLLSKETQSTTETFNFYSSSLEKDVNSSWISTLTAFITAIDFLSNEALNISNLLYMRGDFNVRMLNKIHLSLYILQLARP